MLEIQNDRANHSKPPIIPIVITEISWRCLISFCLKRKIHFSLNVVIIGYFPASRHYFVDLALHRAQNAGFDIRKINIIAIWVKLI